MLVYQRVFLGIPMIRPWHWLLCFLTRCDFRSSTYEKSTPLGDFRNMFNMLSFAEFMRLPPLSDVIGHSVSIRIHLTLADLFPTTKANWHILLDFHFVCFEKTLQMSTLSWKHGSFKHHSLRRFTKRKTKTSLGGNKMQQWHLHPGLKIKRWN